MIDLTLARALHVLAVVHWIGGVAMVTLVILPAVTRLAEPGQLLKVFEAIEHRFAGQAKWSVTIAGLSGFYLTHRLAAWERFLDPAYWWMHAMVLVWLLFTLILFVAEPYFLHDWFRRRAAEAPQATFRLIQRMHWLLLAVSAVTVAGAITGTRGMFL